ncbi:MAG: hypothetical protein ABFC57_06740 [Veillonellales bacterium]
MLCCSNLCKGAIDLKCKLPAFDRAQTEAYVHAPHTGGTEEIFTDKVIDEIIPTQPERPECQQGLYAQPTECGSAQ